MGWHVVTHGHSVTLLVIERTGVVSPFLDIGGKCRAFEDYSHLLGNGDKQVAEDFQFQDSSGGLSLHQEAKAEPGYIHKCTEYTSCQGS